MRYMMDDDQIHPDVVNKLWQAYSKHLITLCPNIMCQNLHCLGSDRPLPKQQRRGAIIIIGMLALARRSVVQDRVDVLLKIGLGPMGKVGPPHPRNMYLISPVEHLGRSDPRQIHLRRITTPQR